MTNKLQNTNNNRHDKHNRFNFAAPVLARQIDALSDSGPEPVRQIQEQLNRLGYGGLDNSLIAGIKQFQKDHGLQVDGVIKAGGETLRKLNQLSRDPQNFRPIATALPDTSGLSLREELEGRFNGTLPIVRTDPQTGFRSAYYFGRENDKADTILKMITPGTYEIGRAIADTKIAYDHWQDMKKANSSLIKKYGPGAAAGTDDYYHPLLQCHLAQMSDTDRVNGLLLGIVKEYFWEYPQKRYNGKSHSVII